MRDGETPARPGRRGDPDAAGLLIADVHAGQLGWQAQLELRFRRDSNASRTLLVERRHSGPLTVQKPLYPEGDPCHVVVLHPPGGVAGGDQIRVSAHLEVGSHALITTPGATRWYKANGHSALQRVALHVDDEARLEWLPQEAIVFNAAAATCEVTVELAPTATYIGSDILCMGRVASGERLTSGSFRQRLTLRRGGRTLWQERGLFDPARGASRSVIAFAGATVTATVLAAAPEISAELLEGARSTLAERFGASAAASRLPGGLLIARYLGDSSEAARRFVISIWSVLRPALIGRTAVTPRLWNV
jgi:urease accessory protein